MANLETYTSHEAGEKIVNAEIRLVKVHGGETNALKEYVAALFSQAEDYDAMVNIEEGVTSLLRNESLATAYFICRDNAKIGYVILTRYHSVEKGGLTLFVDEFYIEEHYRRQGIGHAIMEKIIEIARLEGAKALWAHTERANLAGQAFFTQHGFVVDPYINFERRL